MNVLRRTSRKAALVLFVACVLAFGLRLRLVEPPMWQAAPYRIVSGVSHVHSEASHDSKTPLARIVAEARRLGRDFVIVTDHDVHTQPPKVTGGSESITLLRETELSTASGHLVALRERRQSLAVALDDTQIWDDGPQPSDLTRALRTPEELERFGLWPLVAHPSEAKSPWDGPLPKRGGVEVVNAAAQLRALAAPWGLGLIGPALGGLVRRDALAWALYRAPNAAVARWDALPSKALHGLCGVDSHGWLPLEDELSYWTVMLHRDVAWPTNPQARPKVVLDALVNGRFACVAHLGHALPHFAWGLQPAQRERPERLRVQLDVAASDKHRFELVLLRGGRPVAQGSAPELCYERPAPGLYRAEIWAQLPGLVWGTRRVRVLFSQRLEVAGRGTSR